MGRNADLRKPPYAAFLLTLLVASTLGLPQTLAHGTGPHLRLVLDCDPSMEERWVSRAWWSSHNPGWLDFAIGEKVANGAASLGPVDVHMMEGQRIQGCDARLGIETYFVGKDRTYRLHAGKGLVITNGMTLSPSTDIVGPNGGPATSPSIIAAPQRLILETSLDGFLWTEIQVRNLNWVGVEVPSLDTEHDPQVTTAGTVFGARYVNFFSFSVFEPPEFRFLRVRQPQSAAQGLSGFIEATNLRIEVVEDRILTPPAPTANVQERTCHLDMMDHTFPTHRCWFGGAQHWDAASVYHTYFLDNTTLTRIEVTATPLLYRALDAIADASPVNANPAGAVQSGRVHVHLSEDGERWTELTNAADPEVPYGQQLRLDLDVVARLGTAARARFVQLTGDLHPSFSDPNCGALTGVVVPTAGTGALTPWQKYWLGGVGPGRPFTSGACQRFNSYLADSSVTLTGAFTTQPKLTPPIG